MTDFAACSEQFKSWRGNKARREQLINGLVATIKNADVYPIGAIIPVEDFNSLSEEQRAFLGGDPYYVAFQEATSQMAFANALRYPPEPVSMVYARLKRYTFKAMELWDAIKEYNAFGPWMSSFTPGEPKDHTPLQAADLWAYELGRHFEYVLPNSKPWRWPFKEIVAHALRKGGGHTFFQLCDRKFLLGVLGESGEQSDDSHLLEDGFKDIPT